MNCPNCQTANPESAKFCMNCGTPLVTGKSGESKSKFLDQYLPQELMTKLEAARAREAMVGERRVITMLFCDVKGSTAAAEKVDPGIWTEIINGAFERMIRPIYKYEGIVPRLMGDAILAFFGAPIAHEDDPQRAVLAGLEIQSAIKLYADEIRLKQGLEFGLRVGINTGLVVVGEIGSDLRMEYTAIGDAINLAARMEQTALPGTVQITEDTYKLIAPLFDFESLGEIEVKGKAAPIKAYRVLGAKKTPGHLRGLNEVMGEGFSSPLVGRETQVELLSERLTQLRDGRGSFVSVIGEAGLGKSSLIAEIQRSKPESLGWLKGEALSYSRSISYFPWRQIIRQSIDAREDDSPAEVRGKLRYNCDCCTLPGGDVPFLEAMLAVESEESAQVVMGYQGEALVERMTEATRGYLCGLAGESPLVLVFDDLHWADEASLNLLLNLADLASNRPILLISMLRPDKQAASWDFTQNIQKKINDRFHSIMLEPLRVEQTDTLLSNLLGMKDLPKKVRDLVAEKAEGNPFFVEELIRSLVETKQLIRENSHWRVTSEDAKVSLPDTLRGVLSARIDRLPDATRHVLQTASVIGRSFDLCVLEKLITANELESHIQSLQEAGLVQRGGDEYLFRHVLIQDAAYDSILLKKRAELHRKIGETLEELHANRMDEFAPLLAHHFYAAQDERSLKYDLLAGEKAARLYANAEAATHFSRALEVARRSNLETEQIFQLFSKLGGALELSGRYEQALENYDAMREFGRQHGDRSIEMAALMAKAPIYSIFTRLHDSLRSEQLLLEALEISRELGDRAAQARLNWNLMLNYLFSKRPDQALEHGQLALSLSRESDNREQLAYVLNDLCRLYTCRGEFEKAYAVIEEARGLWCALGNQVMLADSLGSEAEARFNAGEFDLSFERSQQALQITEEIENLWGQSYDRMLMSFILLEKGELSRGIQLADQSVKLADDAGLIASSIGMRSELAWFYAYCGVFEKGLDLIEQALRVAEEKQPAWRAFPQAARIRMFLLHGDTKSAWKIAGDTHFEPISIPYARYTIFLCLANIELAVSKGNYQPALTLSDELLNETAPLTRVDIPEVLRWKAEALLGLNRLDEARQTLTEGRSRAEALGAKPQLWPILASLAVVNSKLGNEKEAEANRREARAIIEQVAESLREIGLRDSFLSRPQVQALMR
ncbi:MAG: AAA family ATPase [Chloroflexi bacterium]|nr:AAA family ATPase [Chloroflexota bacterium]